MVDCIWTNDSVTDVFWENELYDPPFVCRCARCFDARTQQPIEHDLGIFEHNSPQYAQLVDLFIVWVDPNLVISNHDHGEGVAESFKAYVYAEHRALFRLVGRDEGIFVEVVRRWWED